MATQQLALGLPPDMQQSFDQMTPERRQEWCTFLANFDRKEKRRHNRLRKQWFADFGEDVGPFTSTYEWFWEAYRIQIAQAVQSGEYALLGLDYRIARKAAVPLGHADERACVGFSQKPVPLTNRKQGSSIAPEEESRSC